LYETEFIWTIESQHSNKRTTFGAYTRNNSGNKYAMALFRTAPAQNFWSWSSLAPEQKFICALGFRGPRYTNKGNPTQNVAMFQKKKSDAKLQKPVKMQSQIHLWCRHSKNTSAMISTWRAMPDWLLVLFLDIYNEFETELLQLYITLWVIHCNMINSQLRRPAPLDVKSALAPEIPRAGAVSNWAYRRIKLSDFSNISS